MRCPFCWGKWCDCGYVEEVDRAHMAQRAADMDTDEAVTGVYVRTVTERMEAEDEEQRQDMARYGEDD